MSLLNQLEALRADPTRLQGVVYDQIRRVSNGELQFVDPTNPASMCIETVAFTATQLEQRSRVAERATYPALAQDWQDLYRHMSDKDFLGRFGNPSTIQMRFLFSLGELKNLAKPIGDTGISKLVIPKHTKVTVAGIDWLLLYPIEIRFMPRGGVRVVYDTSVITPLLTIESNLVSWSTVRIDDEQMLELVTLVQQLTLTRYQDTLSASNGFKKSYTLTDQFYYCRVFGRSGDRLIELKTTHSNEVYDPKTPTAILEVLGDSLSIEIPLIYFSRGLLPGSIQFDIYTTKGDLTFVASDYVANAFVLEWGQDHNTLEDASYAAPFTTVSTMSVYSIDNATGGTDGLSFDELRERVITNSTQTKLPITDNQLVGAMTLRGYRIIRSIDNIVRRVYLASRSLSAANSGFSTGAGCGIVSVEFPINRFQGQSLFRDNGERFTLMDGLLFDISTGVANYVPEAESTRIRNLPRDRLLLEIAQKQYVYTPLSYVLDTTEDGFAVRAYDFTNPSIYARQFLLENDTGGFGVSTQSLNIQRLENGYELFLVTSSDEAYKQLDIDKLYCQLLFNPIGETDYAHLNGELIGVIDGEYVWRFVITTNFDVDSQKRFWLTNFAMFVETPGRFAAGLDQVVQVIYGAVNYGAVGYKATEIDLRIGRHLLDGAAIAVTNEQFTISFGYHLEQMWCNGRTVAGSLEYLRHTQDVPLVYAQTEYLRDSAGDIILDPDKEPPYTVIKRKGEQVVIAGEPQFKARRGDLIYDEETGEPIPVNTRKTLRIVDLLMVDGVYYFATGESDLNYRKSIPAELVGYIKQDLSLISPILLERTDMYLYPKKTIGQIQVYVQDGQLLSMPAGLSFGIRYWLNSANYSNDLLRESISQRTHDILNRILAERQVGTDDLVVEIRQALGNDIVAVDVDKFGPRKDIPNYTVSDDSARCSVKRKLKALPDGTLRVVEDISIEFILHRTA